MPIWEGLEVTTCHPVYSRTPLAPRVGLSEWVLGVRLAGNGDKVIGLPVFQQDTSGTILAVCAVWGGAWDLLMHRQLGLYGRWGPKAPVLWGILWENGWRPFADPRYLQIIF